MCLQNCPSNRSSLILDVFRLLKHSSSNVKLSVDDASLFSVVHDINASVIELNSDLKKNQ